MFEVLIFISWLLIVAQRTKQRILVALLYSGLCVTHMVIDQYLSDVQYYVVAGIFCIAIMAVVLGLTKQDRFTDGILTVSAVSFLVNLYGWFIYCMGMEPTSYVVLSYAVLLGGIYVLLRKDEANDLCHNQRVGFFRVPFNNLGSYYHKLYRKAQVFK